MDQTLVDVTEIPAVDPGDVAVLLGTSGQETITAYDLAQQAGTITNRSSAAWAPAGSGSSDNPKAPAASRQRERLANGLFPPPSKTRPGTGSVVPCQGANYLGQGVVGVPFRVFHRIWLSWMVM